jgi:hypothetical protein
MRRIASLILCLAFVPALALAGPVLSLTGTGIDAVETSDAEFIVAAMVDAGADVQYCWSAVPGTSASSVASYRYGWNILDPDDPNDSGWAVGETTFDGSEICSPIQVFMTGAPSFTAEITDEAGVSTRVVVQIEVNQAVSGSIKSWGAVKAGY